MSTKSSGRPLVRSSGLSLLLVTGAVAGLTSGCGKSEAATSRNVTPESTQVGATSKAETENFVAEMVADGAYKAGAEGNVSVTLTTRNGHHTNAQYPYKFKLDAAPEGVTYPKPILQRTDGTFEETRGQFKIPFTAAKAGKVTLAGTLSLSVCSDAHCIIDKVALEVPVDVK